MSSASAGTSGGAWPCSRSKQTGSLTQSTLNDNETLLTISAGYADGMRRCAGNRVAVNGVLCDVVGRVTMDAIIVRVPAGKERETADARYAELIGEHWTADDVARGTIMR